MQRYSSGLQIEMKITTQGTVLTKKTVDFYMDKNKKFFLAEPQSLLFFQKCIPPDPRWNRHAPLIKVLFNIVLSSTPRFSKWLLSFSFSYPEDLFDIL
jgi:hypothetical protein